MRGAALAVSTALLLASSAALASGPCVNAADRGQALRDKLKLRAAREEFITCAKDSCPAVVRTECIQWLADVDARLPSIVIRATDVSGRDVDDVRVTIDGVLEESRLVGRRINVDPGLRRLRLEHPGAASIDTQLIAREGEHNRIVDIVFTAPAAAPAAGSAPASAPGDKATPFPIAGVVFAGVAVLGAGAFAYFAASGQSDVDDLRSSCAPRCAASDVSSARTKIAIANIALGVSVVSLGIAGYFFFVPTPDRQGANAAVGGTF
jgi:hypothetical protein